MKRLGSKAQLPAQVGEVQLPSPVMTASGTAGHGAELGRYFELTSIGAVVVKSLSAEPWAGNPSPRVHSAGQGMLNSVGLQNPGVDAWLEHDHPALAASGARIVVSIWGRRADDYRAAAAAIAKARPRGVVAIEANISCPNIEDRSTMFAHSEEGAAAATSAAVAGAGKPYPVWAKLSPNVTDLPAIAGATIEAGAGALVLTNTLMGLAIDPVTGEPSLGNGGGGLSGPPLHPVAVRAVYECRKTFPEIPIVGVGGICRGKDAAEMLAAGADAVQVGTATFADPRAPARIAAELEKWCRRQRVGSLSDLVGRAHRV